MATWIEAFQESYSRLKVWWRDSNQPICRECGLGYQEARDTIKAVEAVKDASHKVEIQLIKEIAERVRGEVAYRELLVMCEKHFVFLKRVAQSPGPLKNSEGKIESKYKVIASECDAASVRIQTYLKENS